MREDDREDIGRVDGPVPPHGRTSGLSEPWLGLLVVADRARLIMAASAHDDRRSREETGRVYVELACATMLMAAAVGVTCTLPPWATAHCHITAATLASVGLYLLENPDGPPQR